MAEAYVVAWALVYNVACVYEYRVAADIHVCNNNYSDHICDCDVHIYNCDCGFGHCGYDLNRMVHSVHLDRNLHIPIVLILLLLKLVSS